MIFLRFRYLLNRCVNSVRAAQPLAYRQAELKKSETEMADSWNKTKDEYQKFVTAASDQAVSAAERDKRKKDADGKLKDLDLTSQIQPSVYLIPNTFKPKTMLAR